MKSAEKKKGVGMDAEMILRIVESISREKNLEKEVIFDAIEQALSIAARRKVDDPEAISFKIDRESGELQLVGDAQGLTIDELGRIAAQTAKQVIIQKVREAERDQIFDEYVGRKGDIASGIVQRFEGYSEAPNLVINIEGRVEAFFPRKEQIFEERFNIGDRVRALLLDVKKQGQRVKLILSRTHPLFVKRLFEIEVPEISDRIIEIKAIEREPGYRSKVAVVSHDMKVDCVGACVGVRGSRIKGIIDELNGEKIDIVRWNESPEILIQNALKPARISSITLDYDRRVARIVVPDDQLSLAIGKRGQNVRLGAKLCRWDFYIITETQEAEWRGKTIAKFKEIEGVDDELAYKIFDAGFDCFSDINAAGPEPIMGIKDMNVEQAAKIIEHVQEHPDPALEIQDAVFAEGSYRMPDGRYLEPGEPRPGEYDFGSDAETEQTSASSAAARFGELFGDTVPEGPKKEVLGDIFAVK
ncbi:MAG: transcription termination factor NusA [Planctomycetaceae bacterium]|nr:transcription termination factor NusA [Planctomycetaceae bacterium]